MISTIFVVFGFALLVIGILFVTPALDEWSTGERRLKRADQRSDHTPPAHERRPRPAPRP